MAVAWSANTTGVNVLGSGGNYSATPTFPSVSAGQLLLCKVHARAGTSVDTIDTPSGFTLETGAKVGIGGGLAAAVFWKIATGSETGTLSVTGTYTGAAPRLSAILELYTGNATTGVPLESVGSNTGTSTTPSPSSVTTSINGGLAVAAISANSATTIGNITGETGGDYTEAYAEFSSGTIVLDTQTAAMATAGTISGGTCTLGASAAWIAICFGIKPPAVAVNTNVTLTKASFALTASSLSAVPSRKVALSAAAYALSAQTLSAKTARKATLSPASLAFTASSLTAQYGRRATLNATSFLVTPSSLAAKTARKLTLSPASLSLSAQNLVANYGRQVTLSPASYGLTAQALTAKTGRKSSLTGAAFVFSANALETAASAPTHNSVTLNAVTFALAGGSLSAKAGRAAALAAASYAFTVQSLTAAYAAGNAAVAYAVTLSPVTFAFNAQPLDAKSSASSGRAPLGYKTEPPSRGHGVGIFSKPAERERARRLEEIEEAQEAIAVARQEIRRGDPQAVARALAEPLEKLELAESAKALEAMNRRALKREIERIYQELLRLRLAFEAAERIEHQRLAKIARDEDAIAVLLLAD